MNIITVRNSREIDKKIIQDIASYISSGKVVVLPAKTIYGLSCAYNNDDALKKIYIIKDRKSDLPFIILFSRLSSIKDFAINISSNAKTLIKYYWDCEEPQPLTIVFKKNKKLDNFIAGGKDTIALRRAEYKFVRDVIDNSMPIISTSATISKTGLKPLDIKDIPQKILENADLTVQLQEKLLGIESTIVEASGAKIKLVRQGVVSFNDILQKLQIKI
ncbi:MAG: L-threonylcarbamoyladenylate synthase [Actinobacteria bacterium]|nr:L-threonylcarbamoyladenylate synthase [Actinomycetota bacterium]